MTTGAKMRVYEIAREVGVPNKELIAKIRALGLEVNNHMSSLDADDVARVKRSLDKERLANTVTKRLSSTVLRRRSKEGGSRQPVEVRRREPAAPPPEDVAPPASSAPRRLARESEPAPASERLQPESTGAMPVESAPAVEPVAAKGRPPSDPPAGEAEVPRQPDLAAQAPAAQASSEVPGQARAPAVGEAPRTQDPEPPLVRRIVAPVILDIPVNLPGPDGKPMAPPVVAKSKPVVDKPAARRKPARAPDPEPNMPEAETVSPQDRFQAELSAARARVEERERERVPASAAGQAEAGGDRPSGRPAVGSVIALPMTRIKITERAPTRTDRRRPPPPPRRVGGRRDQRFPKKRQPMGKKGKQTQITVPAEHKRIIKVDEVIAVQELARHMGIKANEVLKKLWGMGMIGVNINATIDFETASLMAGEFGYDVQNVAFQEELALEIGDDEEGLLEPRSPVVTVMGHVDHGKTTLLDAIRSARVAAGEAGGITQHIAAYRVAVPEMGNVVFLDTPGHEAFTAMRARGAQSTDIVILVVGADDGVMPQTAEAIKHAKDAGVQIIVAVNKCDAPNAQPERVRQQLADYALIPEEWGGDTQYVDISALKNENIDKLLEAVALQAEMLELTANPNKAGVGVVIESRLDRARGPVATVLVQQGTLRAGDYVVAGDYMGKIRAILDDRGKPIKQAGPATPVQLLGIDGVPNAGDMINATDERTAKQVVEHRQQQKRKKELAESGKVSLESLMEKIKVGGAEELKLVLKTDVQGSAEALRDSLVAQSTEKVKVNVISTGVGGITETDVNLAKAGGAIVLGFHVRPAGKSARHAEQEGVEIKLYNIIYDAIDDVRAAMAGLLAPVQRQQEVGRAEVRQTFNITKVGCIAGCNVIQGRILRKSLLRVIRNSVQIHEGRVAQLKRFKDDVTEVKEGYECGVQVDGFNDIQEGDIIESYEIVEEAATL